MDPVEVVGPQPLAVLVGKCHREAFHRECVDRLVPFTVDDADIPVGVHLDEFDDRFG